MFYSSSFLSFLMFDCKFFATNSPSYLFLNFSSQWSSVKQGNQLWKAALVSLFTFTLLAVRNIPHFSRKFRAGQPGLSSIKINFRQVIFQPMVFSSTQRRRNENPSVIIASSPFPPPLTASPLTCAISCGSLRSPLEMESLLAGCLFPKKLNSSLVPLNPWETIDYESLNVILMI